MYVRRYAKCGSPGHYDEAFVMQSRRHLRGIFAHLERADVWAVGLVPAVVEAVGMKRTPQAALPAGELPAQGFGVPARELVQGRFGHRQAHAVVDACTVEAASASSIAQWLCVDRRKRLAIDPRERILLQRLGRMVAWRDIGVSKSRRAEQPFVSRRDHHVRIHRSDIDRQYAPGLGGIDQQCSAHFPGTLRDTRKIELRTVMPVADGQGQHRTAMINRRHYGISPTLPGGAAHRQQLRTTSLARSTPDCGVGGMLVGQHQRGLFARQRKNLCGQPHGVSHAALQGQTISRHLEQFRRARPHSLGLLEPVLDRYAPRCCAAQQCGLAGSLHAAQARRLTGTVEIMHLVGKQKAVLRPGHRIGERNGWVHVRHHAVSANEF